MDYAKYPQLKESGNIKIVSKDNDMYFEQDKFDTDTGEKKQLFEGCHGIDFHKSQLAGFEAAVAGLKAIIADQQTILDAQAEARKKAESEASEAAKEKVPA